MVAVTQPRIGIISYVLVVDGDCQWRISSGKIFRISTGRLELCSKFRRFVFFVGCISHWEGSRGWIRHTPNFYNFGSLIEILECFIDTSYTETYTITVMKSLHLVLHSIFLITETQNMYTDLNTDRFTLVNMYIYIYICVCANMA